MKVLETARLSLRWLREADAPFILTLVNQPSWLRFIGDKNVHSLEDARAYIANGPAAMYARHGFGLYRVALKADDTAIGLCGLIRRDTLPDVDIGFAFLPAHWGQGYAEESAAAVLAFARDTLGLQRIVAITSLDNSASARLLEKIGLRFERNLQLDGSAETLRLFATTH